MTRLLVGGITGWEALRRRLIRSVWGTGGVPTTAPTVELDVAVGGLSGVAGIDQVDRLTYDMPRGAEAVIHVLTPTAAANGRACIIHGGHSITYHDATTRMEVMTEALLAEGYLTVGVCMPDTGYNANPLVLDLAGGGTEEVVAHDFGALEADGVHSWRWLVEPTLLAGQYLASLGHATWYMTGLSGGGWTTDMASAIERRITRSAPVFGSVPFSLRPPGDAGDWEQLAARSWWDILTAEGGTRDYEVAYAMGCGDRGRRRMQVLGTDDPVFPVATRLPQVEAIEAWVDARVPDGQHSILVDTTATDHEYSDETVAAIVAFFEAA